MAVRDSIDPSDSSGSSGVDTVVVLGKGHEKGQEIHGVKHPFDDRDAVRSALSASRRGRSAVIPLNLAELVEVTGGELHGSERPGRRGRRRRRDHRLAGVRTGQPLRRPGRRVRRRPRLRPGRRGGGRRGGPRLATHRGRATIAVDDVQTAFGALARGVVDRAPGVRVVGITGSSGKTTTKDLLASVLSTAGETVAPLNSLNGEIGVPLTVCRITPATRYLVVEMGARGIGHVEYLTHIAPPQVAIVLNVGTAHVGEFGSRDNIALAKAELPGRCQRRAWPSSTPTIPSWPRCASGLHSPRPARRALAWCGGARGGRRRRQAGQSGIRPHRPAGALRSRCAQTVPTTWPTHSPWRRQRSSSGCRSTGWRRPLGGDAGEPLADGDHRAPGRRRRRQRRLQRQPRLDARGARRARRHRDVGSALGRPRRDARARGGQRPSSTPPSGRMPPGWVSTTSWRSATGRGAYGAVEWLPDVDAAHEFLEARLAAGRRRLAQVEPRQRATVAR